MNLLQKNQSKQLLITGKELEFARLYWIEGPALIIEELVTLFKKPRTYKGFAAQLIKIETVYDLTEVLY